MYPREGWLSPAAWRTMRKVRLAGISIEAMQNFALAHAVESQVVQELGFPCPLQPVQIVTSLSRKRIMSRTSPMGSPYP